MDGDFSLAFRVWLDDAAYDMGNDQADGVLCEWVGRDGRGMRHYMSLEVITPGTYVKGHKRFLAFIVDKWPYAVEFSRLKPGTWHDLVLRVCEGKVMFFVNGAVNSAQAVRNFPAQATLSLSPAGFISGEYIQFGRNRRGDLPFTGKLARAAIWNRALDDEEIRVLSGVDALVTELPRPKDWSKRWAGLYEEDIERENALQRMHRDYEAFYRRVLKEDPYFPRFHLALPGMMTEPSVSSYKLSSGYHIYPHDCGHWQTQILYRSCHAWQHFYGKDLLDWSLLPLAHDEANTGNMIETEDGTICYPQEKHRKVKPYFYRRWISTDENQQTWRFDKDILIPTPPSGVFPYNHYLFEHDGKQYLLGSYAALGVHDPAIASRMELYRSKDNSWDNWEYVGPFHESDIKGVHHPKLFFVDGKVVVDTSRAIDKDAWYVLGRFEDEKFVKEGAGHFNFDNAGWAWGQTITEPDARVLRWALIYSPTSADNLFQDNFRRGWSNAYTIPRVMGIRNGKLTQVPAPELAGLRSAQLLDGRSRVVEENQPWFPELDGSRGTVEIRCRFKAGDSTAGIELKASDDDRIRFYFDGASSQVVCQTDLSPTGGASMSNSLHKNAETKINALPGDEVELVLYFDRSVIEVYADGEASAARWFPESPDTIDIGFFSENGNTRFDGIVVWQMGTIWKDYIGE
jgi:sucrose-6-phosphate hydrolase SacC (GH32 family)